MGEGKDQEMSWPQIRARHYFELRRQKLTAHIRALREQHGLGQQEIADWLGCSRSRIARIENGKGGYSLEELEFLAQRLGQDPGRLTRLLPEPETLLHIVFTNEWSHRALGETFMCIRPPELSVPQAAKIALSPDNALLAASLQIQRGDEVDRPEVIVLWEARTGAIKQKVPLDGWASAMAFSPDGRLLAIGTAMDTVKILDCGTGRFLAYLDPVEDGYSEPLWAYINEVGYGVISAVCFSPNGQYLAAVNEDHGTLRLWERGQWQAVNTWALNSLYDDEWGEEESPFGEFSVSQVAFTPDSRRIVVIPLLSHTRTAAFFNVPSGERSQRLAFPERVLSVGMMAPSDPEAGAIFAFGGQNHFWEAAYGEWGHNGRSWLTLYTAPAEAGEWPIQQTIRQVVVLSERCVLGLIERNRPEGLPCWSVANLVSHQPAVLLDLGQEGSLAVTVRLADNGAALAFADSVRQRLGVRPLQAEYLQAENAATAATLSAALPEGILQRGRPATGADQPGQWLAMDEVAAGEIGSAGEAFELDAFAAGDPSMASLPIEEELAAALHDLKTATPRAQGGYGLAQLAPGDQATVRRVVERIRVETGEKPLLIELPERGPEIRRRALIGYIVGRPLRRGEFTDEWARRLVVERPYTLIFIDNAERLHPEALMWVCANLRTVTDAFILAVHHWEKFAEVAGRNHDLAWVLGRSIPVDLVGLAR